MSPSERWPGFGGRRQSPFGETAGRQERGAPSRFTVVAERSEAMTKWLRVQGRILDDPMISTDGGSERVTLPLGSITLNDTVLNGIQAGLSVDPRDGSYSLNVGFPLQGPSVNPLMGVFSGGSIYVEGADQYSQPPAAVSDFVGRLQYNPAFSEEYTIAYDGRRDRVTITPKQDESEETHGTEFTFRRIDHPMSPGYYLTLPEDNITDESIDRLPEHHRRIAALTQHIVGAMYDLRGEEAPDETFVMAPPKNTEKAVERQEAQIESQRRMLSASGVVDDSEVLAAEVERNIVLERRPDVTFDDIGGNEEAKETLEIVANALRDPESYRMWGTQPPRGVTLFGPPGTGKTLLAKALANEAEADIYVVNTADVLHSLYGKTERLIQAVFDRAQGNGPAVILFDELDALARDRSNSHELNSRIVSVLLQNLDGLEERDSNVIVVGTTNRLDTIDPALLRPKRFGDVLAEVELPKPEAREQIFGIHMNKARQRAGREIFAPDLEITQLNAQTDGFSGADIEEIIRRTLAQKARLQSQGHQPGPVTIEELLDTAQRYARIRKAKEANTGQYL